MVVQPTGTVTLLFSDIEASTRLLERLGADAYGRVLERHRELLRARSRVTTATRSTARATRSSSRFAIATGAVTAAEQAEQSLASRFCSQRHERLRM
jgi:hypothetical protein